MHPNRHKTLSLAAWLFCAVLLGWCNACTSAGSLQDHYLLPNHQWPAGQNISFELTPLDTLSKCIVFLDVRLDKTYSYPYIGVTLTDPKNTSKVYWLSLKDGNPKGNDFVTDYRFTLDSTILDRLPVSSQWTLTQQTTNEPLTGIVSVGLCIAPQRHTAKK